MIALSGLLAASAIASVRASRAPAFFTYYWEAIMIIGIAFVIVGFARQAQRMFE